MRPALVVRDRMNLVDNHGLNVTQNRAALVGSRDSKTTTKSVRPGIMPILFGRHLIDKAVFLSLNEVADNLPPLEEECIHVSMDEELAMAYRQDVEKPLAEAIKEMLRRKDRRLLGTMLQPLLAYPDHPFGWEPIGYRKAGEFVKVA